MTGRAATVTGDAEPDLLDISVGALLRQQAEAFADRPAVMWAADDGGDSVAALSYSELLNAANSTARVISEHAEPGDRVCVWAANCPEWVVVEMASALAGTTLTSMNPALTGAEARHALALTGPRLLFAGTDGRGADLAAQAASLLEADDDCAVLDLGTVALRPGPTAFDGPVVMPDDPFIIQLTSGTTGRAKGATLSHRSAVNSGYLRAHAVGADETDVWLNPVPLHHMSGAVVMVTCALSTGGCYVVMPRFDPQLQVALMAASGATRTGGVPTMFHRLLECPGGPEAMSRVKSVGLGGAVVPPALVESLQGFGSMVSLAYAQSECPMVTQSDPSKGTDHVATTVGVVVPHTEIRITDASGATLGVGTVGEIRVRSPLTMLGYWGSPAATEEAYDSDGFLRTGDLGSIDDEGVVRVRGRAREVIIRGGENVYPAEVEQALECHPAVQTAAVIGVPSAEYGEEVAAVVQTVAGGSPTAAELEKSLAAELAHFKIPRHWRFVTELPSTASGKVRKFELAPLFEPSQSE